jgi:hypothetical protein
MVRLEPRLSDGRNRLKSLIKSIYLRDEHFAAEARVAIHHGRGRKGLKRRSRLWYAPWIDSLPVLEDFL